MRPAAEALSRAQGRLAACLASTSRGTSLAALLGADVAAPPCDAAPGPPCHPSSSCADESSVAVTPLPRGAPNNHLARLWLPAASSGRAQSGESSSGLDLGASAGQRARLHSEAAAAFQAPHTAPYATFLSGYGYMPSDSEGSSYEVRQLVVTANGPDRPGLVSKLTKRILESGGNVEQSRMARLAGEFSVIMLVSVDATVPRVAQELEARLAEVEGLQISARWAEECKAKQGPRKKFRRIFLKGADNPGLVYNVAEYLAGNKINIENLETSTEEAPFGGSTLFTMEGVIAMPVAMSTQNLVRCLDVLQGSLGVQIELRNMDPRMRFADMARWRESAEEVGGVSRYSVLAQQGSGRRGDGDTMI